MAVRVRYPLSKAPFRDDMIPFPIGRANLARHQTLSIQRGTPER